MHKDNSNTNKIHTLAYRITMGDRDMIETNRSQNI